MRIRNQERLKGGCFGGLHYTIQLEFLFSENPKSTLVFSI